MRLGRVALGLADRVSLEHEEAREWRAKAHRRSDQGCDPCLIRPLRECSKGFGERHAKCEVRDQLPRPHVPSRGRRAFDERPQGRFECQTRVEADDDRVQKDREIVRSRGRAHDAEEPQRAECLEHRA